MCSCRAGLSVFAAIRLRNNFLRLSGLRWSSPSEAKVELRSIRTWWSKGGWKNEGGRSRNGQKRAIHPSTHPSACMYMCRCKMEYVVEGYERTSWQTLKTRFSKEQRKSVSCLSLGVVLNLAPLSHHFLIALNLPMQRNMYVFFIHCAHICVWVTRVLACCKFLKICIEKAAADKRSEFDCKQEEEMTLITIFASSPQWLLLLMIFL